MMFCIPPGRLDTIPQERAVWEGRGGGGEGEGRGRRGERGGEVEEGAEGRRRRREGEEERRRGGKRRKEEKGRTKRERGRTSGEGVKIERREVSFPDQGLSGNGTNPEGMHYMTDTCACLPPVIWPGTEPNTCLTRTQRKAHEMNAFPPNTKSALL